MVQYLSSVSPLGLYFPLPVPALKLKLSYFIMFSSLPKTTRINMLSPWPGQSPQRLELTSVFTMGIPLIHCLNPLAHCW